MISISFAGTSEPCKGLAMPENVKEGKLVFEIPTYDEYVHGVVLHSLTSGKATPEEKILNESTYLKISKLKVRTIKSTYKGQFDIMSKKEVAQAGKKVNMVLQENVILDLVNENSTKFEDFTSFSIKDINTSSEYTLTNPSASYNENCLVDNNNYKFSDLIAIIQQ